MKVGGYRVGAFGAEKWRVGGGVTARAFISTVGAQSNRPAAIDIMLTKAVTPPGENRLFFCNLGGDQREEFSELHRNVLLVAPDAKAATRKAR